MSFLAECSGRNQFDKSDIDAEGSLVSLPTKDEKQFAPWMDAYFGDVL